MRDQVSRSWLGFVLFFARQIRSYEGVLPSLISLLSQEISFLMDCGVRYHVRIRIAFTLHNWLRIESLRPRDLAEVSALFATSECLKPTRNREISFLGWSPQRMLSFLKYFAVWK